MGATSAEVYDQISWQWTMGGVEMTSADKGLGMNSEVETKQAMDTTPSDVVDNKGASKSRLDDSMILALERTLFSANQVHIR